MRERKCWQERRAGRKFSSAQPCLPPLLSSSSSSPPAETEVKGMCSAGVCGECRCKKESREKVVLERQTVCVHVRAVCVVCGHVGSEIGEGGTGFSLFV